MAVASLPSKAPPPSPNSGTKASEPPPSAKGKGGSDFADELEAADAPADTLKPAAASDGVASSVPAPAAGTLPRDGAKPPAAPTPMTDFAQLQAVDSQPAAPTTGTTESPGVATQVAVAATGKDEGELKTREEAAVAADVTAGAPPATPIVVPVQPPATDFAPGETPPVVSVAIAGVAPKATQATSATVAAGDEAATAQGAQVAAAPAPQPKKNARANAAVVAPTGPAPEAAIAGDSASAAPTPPAKSETPAPVVGRATPPAAPGDPALARAVAAGASRATESAGTGFTGMAGLAGPPLAPAPASHSGAPAASSNSAQPNSAPVPVQMASVAIGMQALEGAREFQIKLDPEHLGRVDVKLTIGNDGRVEASLIVDKVETLAMLQRDSRTLERAFDQAGLTADSDSINYSLRQDMSGQQQRGDQQPDAPRAKQTWARLQVETAVDVSPTYWRTAPQRSGVDIRV